MTKEEIAQYQKNYRIKNAEKINIQRVAHHEKTKHLIKEKRKNMTEKERQLERDKSRVYYDNIENKERKREREKIYYHNNKEKINKKRREKYNKSEELKKYNSNRGKEYVKNNKTSVNAAARKYKNNRCKVDPLFKLERNIGSLIRNVIKKSGYNKNTKTFLILGCSYEEFIEYLKSKFEPWMNWVNYGLYNGKLNYGWDIDHVIPISSAKTEDEVIKLNHYTNLQPLCSYTNRCIKRAKY